MDYNTAIDIALGISGSEGEKGDQILIGRNKETKVMAMNNELALALFDCIKDYSFLHSSPYLVQAIIKAIEY